MSSFKYNIVSDEVEDTIAESTYDMMKNDKLTGAQDFMEFDLSAMSLDKEESERPQASILGKMYSGQDSISTQHHVGRSRAPQTTSDDDIIEITQEELKELQHAMLLHTQTKGKISERKNVLHIANMDTNTMLQQIRARKLAKTQNTVDIDSEEDESQESETEGQDEDMEEYEVDEHDHTLEEYEEEDHDQESEEDDNQQSMTMEKEMDHEEEEYPEEDETMNENNTYTSGLKDDDDDSNGMLATNRDQIGQSIAVGNEPPTPSREGGRG